MLSSNWVGGVKVRGRFWIEERVEVGDRCILLVVLLGVR